MKPEQRAALHEIVWVDRERMSGQPCFKGTRVPIQALIDHIEGDSTLEEFLEGFPSVSRAVRSHAEAAESLGPNPIVPVSARSRID